MAESFNRLYKVWFGLGQPERCKLSYEIDGIGPGPPPEKSRKNLPWELLQSRLFQR